MDVVMYFYIVDDMDTLLGVTDIGELIMAADRDLLKDLMVKNVISLNPGSTMKQAADMFFGYSFRRFPSAMKTTGLWVWFRIAT